MWQQRGKQTDLSSQQSFNKTPGTKLGDPILEWEAHGPGQTACSSYSWGCSYYWPSLRCLLIHNVPSVFERQP